jgi:hypothetical protein
MSLYAALSNYYTLKEGDVCGQYFKETKKKMSKHKHKKYGKKMKATKK